MSRKFTAAAMHVLSAVAALAAIFGALLLTTNLAAAAEGDLEWASAVGVGGFGNSAPYRDVAVDSGGNVYLTGTFRDTTDFDPGPGTMNLTSAGNTDLFVQKLDANGALLWARRVGGTGYEEGLSIAVDALGNAYITSSFSGTIDFDPGAGVFNLVSAGSSDAFILKLDSSGNFVWARRMGGATGVTVGWAIAVDASGNAYATGYFDDPAADFDPGPGTFSLTSAGSIDVFVCKLASDGSFAWARRLGGPSAEWGLGIAVDDVGNAHIGGRFEGTADFDPGAGTTNLISAGGWDAFVVKLDAAGNLAWARRFGGSNDDELWDVALDASGNVHTTGAFAGTVDFDPGPGTAYRPTAGGTDIFVQKLDGNGDYLWARRAGGTSNDLAYSLRVDTSGNVYTVGVFYGTADFDPGAPAYMLNSAGLDDVFVQKLNSAGLFVSALRMGGPGSDRGLSIERDHYDSLIVAGRFQSTADFDPGAGTANLTSAGDYSGFVAKLYGPPPAAPTSPVVTPTSTSSLTFAWQDNAANESGYRVYADSGAAAATLRTTTAANVTSWSWTGLAPNANYTFRAAATNVNGDSASTAAATAYTWIEPIASLVFSEVNTDSISVQASNAPSNLDAGSSGIRIANTTFGADSGWHTDVAPWVSEGLTPNTEYSFSAMSRNGNGLETAPAAAMKWTLAATPLAPVVSLPTGTTLAIGIAAGDGNPPDTVYALRNLDSGNWVQGDGALAVTPVYRTAADWNGTTVGGLSEATSYSFAAVALNGEGVASSDSPAGVGATLDVTAPDAVAITPSTLGPTTAGAIAFSVEFDEDVSNFDDAADLVISHLGTSHTGASISGGPEVYTVTVTGIAGTGSFTLAVSDAGDVEDLGGNALASSVTSAPVVIDNTPPTLAIGPPSAPLTRNGPVAYSVAFGGADTIELDAADITVYATGTASATVNVTGNSAVRTVTLTSIAGDGTLGIGIESPGVATDLAGNSTPPSGPSAVFEVDNTGPVFSNVSVTPSEAVAGDVVTISFSATEPLSGEAVVKVNGFPATPSVATPGHFDYMIGDDDPIGPASISIEGVDAAGNDGLFVDAVSLTIGEVNVVPLAGWYWAMAVGAAGGWALRRKTQR